jgi:hypothetical protein
MVTVLCSAVALGAAGAASASAAVTYVPNCGNTGYLDFKPSYWSAGCTGGSPMIMPIRWTVWNGRAARATGTAQLREPCGNQPCYTAGMYHADGKLRLSAPRTCTDDDTGQTRRYFSRARWSIRYRSHNPFGRRPGWHSMTFSVIGDSCTARRERSGRPVTTSISHCCRSLIAAAAATAMLLAVTGPAAGSPISATQVKHCGEKTWVGSGGGYAMIIQDLRVRGVTCSTGLRVAGRAADGHPLSGWNCRGSLRVRCTRGNRVVTYVPGGDAG